MFGAKAFSNVLYQCMKSALLAAIFGITGLVAILLAVPAEENAPVIKIHPPKSVSGLWGAGGTSNRGGATSRGGSS